MHACGPGPIPAISTTFTPRSGPVPCPSSYVMRVSLTLPLSGAIWVVRDDLVAVSAGSRPLRP